MRARVEGGRERRERDLPQREGGKEGGQTACTGQVWYAVVVSSREGQCCQVLYLYVYIDDYCARVCWHPHIGLFIAYTSIDSHAPPSSPPCVRWYPMTEKQTMDAMLKIVTLNASPAPPITERPRAPGGVAVFMSAHSKTPYITPSMNFYSGKGVVRGRRVQQLEFALP